MRVRIHLRGGQTIELQADKVETKRDPVTNALTGLAWVNQRNGRLLYTRLDAVDAVETSR